MATSASVQRKELHVAREVVVFAIVESALFLSRILTVFCPIPVVLTYRRYGALPAVGMTLVSAAMTFAVYAMGGRGQPNAVALAEASALYPMLVALGFVIGYGLRHEWNFSRLLVRPILATSFFVLGFVGVYYFGFHQGMTGIIADLESTAATVKESLQPLFQQGGSAEELGLSEMAKEFMALSNRDLAVQFLHLLPLAAFWTLCLTTWVTVHGGIYYQLVREWRNSGQDKSPVQTASDENALAPQVRPWVKLWKESFYWRLPDVFIYPWIASGVLAVLPATAVYHEAFMLIFKVLGTFYCFQGVSVARFFLEFWRVPVFMRFAFYGLVVLLSSTVGFFALMGIGVLDFWGDFRKKHTKGEAL
jgi:hypothetical protein